MFFKENVIFILCFTHLVEPSPVEPEAVATTEQTRRILRGVEVHDTRPYMVYLRPAPSTDTNQPPDPNWLCGGAIIHERYVLTSAACIEDVKHFYVVSGTNKWLPTTDTDDECIKNGAKKAVWKCVPKNYVYDGNEFDNIRWMSGDLAVVKVEDNFNFERRVKGCDFVPKMIPFNNQSADFEKAGTVASAAGWGSIDRFGDLFQKRTATVNSPNLLETEVVLVSKKNCKKRWEPRYHTIIDESMICAKDGHDLEDTVCTETEVDCKELVYSEEDDDDDDVAPPSPSRRFMVDPKVLQVHSAAHFHSNQSFRRYQVTSGGFCENDHGGPLVHGQGKSAIVIGVISACLTKSVSKKCYGPFLYTSVYKYRNVITCAIDKDIYGEKTCKIFLRASKTSLKETTFDWSGHPHGAAKSESRSTPRTKQRNPIGRSHQDDAQDMAQKLHSLRFKKVNSPKNLTPKTNWRANNEEHITPERNPKKHTSTNPLVKPEHITPESSNSSSIEGEWARFGF